MFTNRKISQLHEIEANKQNREEEIISAERPQNALTEMKGKTVHVVQNCKPKYIAFTLSAEMGDK